MHSLVSLVIDLAIILVLWIGIAQFRDPRTARLGNLLAAFSLLLALGLLVWRHPILGTSWVLAAWMVGIALAYPIASRVNMIHIPSMVAIQNGAGGLAACMVSLIEIQRSSSEWMFVHRMGGFLGVILGALTFSGSMVAAGKLSGRLKQTPALLPGHRGLLLGMASILLASGILFTGPFAVPASIFLLAVVGVAICLGAMVSMGIGGADMPVLISFLNSCTGLAAACCGLAIPNRFLIACGAMVGSSGWILTHAMCRAMNRNLGQILLASDIATRPAAPESAQRQEEPLQTNPIDEGTAMDRAIAAAREAKTILVVPGYGMALAQAQFDVVALANRLETLGKDVRYAIHPVAGRMPGHMNVLLAEAEADYSKLCPMDQINAFFKETDLAIVVGACDVVNPSAIHVEGTPISGMPILMVQEARCIVVCNLDDKPGYSGVNNPLYTQKNAILLWGDAKASVRQWLQALD